jgi:hypothetical protein
MAQQNDSNGYQSPHAAGSAGRVAVVSQDRTADPVAIFSAPDVVFHWWVESKRRWAEQNRGSALTARPLVASGAAYTLSADSE